MANESTSQPQDGPIRKGFFKVTPGKPSYDEDSSSALLTFFFYSALMFTVPLAVYFGMAQLCSDYHLEEPYNVLVPVLASVVSVNIIIVLYAIRAYREDKKEKQS